MSDSTHDGGTRASFVAQSSLVTQLPDERLAVLKEMEFAVLKDGEASGMKGTRDLCLSGAIGGLIGLVSLFVSIDWQASIEAAELKPFICTGVLAVITFVSLGIGIFCQAQINRTKRSSAYSILMKRLEDHFSTTASNVESQTTR
jgi:hypothetical protein